MLMYLSVSKPMQTVDETPTVPACLPPCRQFFFVVDLPAMPDDLSRHLVLLRIIRISEATTLRVSTTRNGGLYP